MNQRKWKLIHALQRKLDRNSEEMLEWFAYEHQFLFPNETIEKPKRSQEELQEESDYLVDKICSLISEVLEKK